MPLDSLVCSHKVDGPNIIAGYLSDPGRATEAKQGEWFKCMFDKTLLVLGTKTA